MKYRYVALNFEMPAVQKRGHLITPEFEHGRIVVQEQNLANSNKSLAVVGIMKRPEDEEAENSSVFRYGFVMPALSRGLLGYMNVTKFTRNARFTIDVNPEEQSKGYGSVLMNAGAKNCRDSGIEGMQAMITRTGDLERRIDFYENLGIPVKLCRQFQLETRTDNPRLNAVHFKKDAQATEILNSIPSLQIG